MTVDSSAVLVAVKAVVLVLGGTITYLAYKASRRTQSVALRAFAAGFGVITLGALVAGGLDKLVGVGLQTSVLVQSALTAAGFAVLAYSLYATDPEPLE